MQETAQNNKKDSQTCRCRGVLEPEDSRWEMPQASKAFRLSGHAQQTCRQVPGCVIGSGTCPTGAHAREWRQV